jgi:hypothetical protein
VGEARPFADAGCAANFPLRAMPLCAVDTPRSAQLSNARDARATHVFAPTIRDTALSTDAEFLHSLGARSPERVNVFPSPRKQLFRGLVSRATHAENGSSSKR